MAEKKMITALVTGGEATAGPPLGPALGPLGVNVMAIVNKINESTKDYSGMRVPVKIVVDTETKQFEVEVGVPTTSALVAKEANIAKGSGNPKTQFAGELSREAVIKIAKAKAQQSYGATLTSVAKEVIGSCVSLGVKVDGKDPREVFKDIDSGKWNDVATQE